MIRQFIVGLALTAACGSGARDGGVVVRDSAGVAIVESAEPLWGPDEGWRVAPDPSVTIGTADGPDEEQLFRVRSALRLDDGTIVVANAGSHQLRFYDPDGSYRSASGRQGGGPGEFVSISRLWRLGDSLFVFDFQQGNRLSVFDTAGRFARSFTLDLTREGRLPVLLDLFADRRLLVMAAPRDEELREGLSRDTALFVTYTFDGREADTVGRFSREENYIRTERNRVMSIDRPYGIAPQRAIAGDRMYFGTGERYEIGLYTSAGVVQRLIRLPLPNPALTPDEREEFAERLRQRLPSMAPSFRALYEQVELPSTKPAYGRLLVDGGGHLWAAGYERRRARMNRWNVFRPDGRWLGLVETPPGLLVYEIGTDYVLGLRRDTLDVEYVELFALTKPGDTSP